MNRIPPDLIDGIVVGFLVCLVGYVVVRVVWL